METAVNQEYNPYGAKIRAAVNTPEKRLRIVKKVLKQFFKLALDGDLPEFHHLDTFNNNNDPSIYWVYTFQIRGFKFYDGDLKKHTITIDNDGGIDFNLHRLYIDAIN